VLLITVLHFVVTSKLRGCNGIQKLFFLIIENEGLLARLLVSFPK